MSSNFFDIFYSKYYPILGKRKDTFKQIFTYLDSLNQESYLIVETGTLRVLDSFSEEGNATLLFDLYLNTEKDGILYSIDIDPTNCETSNSNTSDKTVVILGDSVKTLSKITNPEKIDLLYLDSMDWNSHPDAAHYSSLHHIKELTTVYAKLKPGCLIVVDDCYSYDEYGTPYLGGGKGEYINQFFKEIGLDPYFENYQIGYIKP